MPPPHRRRIRFPVFPTLGCQANPKMNPKNVPKKGSKKDTKTDPKKFFLLLGIVSYCDFPHLPEKRRGEKRREEKRKQEDLGFPPSRKTKGTKGCGKIPPRSSFRWANSTAATPAAPPSWDPRIPVRLEIKLSLHWHFLFLHHPSQPRQHVKQRPALLFPRPNPLPKHDPCHLRAQRTQHRSRAHVGQRVHPRSLQLPPCQGHLLHLGPKRELQLPSHPILLEHHLVFRLGAPSKGCHLAVKVRYRLGSRNLPPKVRM